MSKKKRSSRSRKRSASFTAETAVVVRAFLIACKAVVDEDAYKCLCGDPPYEDGELCPVCLCEFMLDKFAPSEG
jgi:hypothetical protein